MTDLKQAAQQALEVISWLRLHLQRDHQCLHMDQTSSGIPAWVSKSQTALEAALAAPQPEPLVYMGRDDVQHPSGWRFLHSKAMANKNSVALYTSPPQRQPLTKPVAFLWQHSETGFTNILPPDCFLDTGAKWFCVGPLYLHPQKRQPLTVGD